MKFVFLLLSSVNAFMNRTGVILSVQENDDGSLFQTAYPYNCLSPGLLRTVLRSLHHAATATMLRTSWRNFRCTYTSQYAVMKVLYNSQFITTQISVCTLYRTPNGRFLTDQLKWMFKKVSRGPLKERRNIQLCATMLHSR